MNVIATEVLFWSALAFCVYTLAGYVACLLALGLMIRRKRIRAEIEPTVSILIAVRNAAGIIAVKLQNCIALDYPKDKIEIVVSCDGPSVATEEIVASFAEPRIRCVAVPPGGKSAALGAALESSSGDIVVFTDAGVQLDPEGIRAIVASFADPKVGCVSSEDVTRGEDGNAEPLYVVFDRWMRRCECRVSTLIGVSGSFFAARREVCRDWDNQMTSDFFVPLRAIEKGFDVVVAPEARGYVAAGTSDQEFARKVRTVVNGIHVLFSHWRLLNPFRYPFVAWCLASRKLFRWLLPFALAALFASNAMLWSAGALYRWLLIAQVVFYNAGIVALILKPSQKLLPFKVAGFFLMGNAAAVKAWWDFMRGERYVSWKPTRRVVPGGESLSRECAE